MRQGRTAGSSGQTKTRCEKLLFQQASMDGGLGQQAYFVGEAILAHILQFISQFMTHISALNPSEVFQLQN